MLWYHGKQGTRSLPAPPNKKKEKKKLGVIFGKQMIITAQQSNVIMGSLLKNWFHKCLLNFVLHLGLCEEKNKLLQFLKSRSFL